MPKIHVTTYIQARAVTEVAPGIFQVEIPCEEISPEDRLVIKRLFPHLTDAAYDLLHKETVMSCVTSWDAVNAVTESQKKQTAIDDIHGTPIRKTKKDY